MTNPMVLFSSSACVFIKPESFRSPALNFIHGLSSVISVHKTAIQFVGSQSLLHLSMSRGMQRNFAVYNSFPGVPLPPGDPSGSWKCWALGIVVSLVLPFLTNKWGPFLKLKNEVEAVVETAEHIADAVEKVAEEVEKVAEDALDNLPAGNLKNMVSVIENVAERTGDGAELVGDLIDKVQEVEEKLESFVESVTDEGTDNQKEVSVTDEETDNQKEVSVTDEAKEPPKEPKVEEDHK